MFCKKKPQSIYHLSNSSGISSVFTIYAYSLVTKVPFVEMALKYTYKPQKFYHRVLSIRIISY